MATDDASRTREDAARKRTARTLALAVALIVWIAVEVVVIGYQADPPLQLIYEGVGLLILLLTLKPLEGGAVRPGAGLLIVALLTAGASAQTGAMQGKGANHLRTDHPRADSFRADSFRADYLEACALVASKYVYFERKCDQTREGFLEERRAAADSLAWSPQVFVRELRALRARFPDGHFSWRVPQEISPVEGFHTLGFAATFTRDSLLIIERVFAHYAPELRVGDIILAVDGVESAEALHRWAARAPQSTPAATLEVAARNLALIKGFAPLLDEPGEVTLTLSRGGRVHDVTLTYQRCPVTTSVSESASDPAVLLLQRNGYLSLEEIPTDHLAPHPALLLYRLSTPSRGYAVLHARDFRSWQDADIDSAMRVIHAWAPDALVIDLKDCSGGAFNQMLMMSHAVGVTEPFRFFYDMVDEDGRRRSGVGDFTAIAERIHIEHPWDGELIVRSNEICGSACDFFLRWMRLHGRAVIVGTAPAGRGGGTDRFELDRTGASISFPLRERIPFGYRSSLEGETMKVDVLSELKLPALLGEFERQEAGGR